MNPRAPSGSRTSGIAQPGEPTALTRDYTGQVLGELDTLLRECPRHELPAWYAALQARIGVVIARLLDRDDSRASRPKTTDNAKSSEPDRLLSPKEAATRLGVGVRWLYAHADEIPGTKRLSRRMLRISKRGLERFLAAREGRRVG